MPGQENGMRLGSTITRKFVMGFGSKGTPDSSGTRDEEAQEAANSQASY